MTTRFTIEGLKIFPFTLLKALADVFSEMTEGISDSL
jgi:hypothetical protein